MGESRASDELSTLFNPDAGPPSERPGTGWSAFKRIPKMSTCDMSMEIKLLVRLVHPYVPTEHRSQQVVDHLMHNLDNKAVVVGTVHAIEEYLPIGCPNRPVRRRGGG